MKYVMWILSLFLFTLITAANTTPILGINDGIYLNQTISRDNGNIVLFCDNHNNYDHHIFRELIKPDGSIITINTPEYITEPNDLIQTGKYEFHCELQNNNTELLILSFDIGEETNDGSLDYNDYSKTAIIAFIVLITLIIIIGGIIWLQNL